MAERILIVEDDPNISKLVAYNLGKAGYRTVAVGSGETALETLANESVDLVILDIMLPGIDGLEVCRKIRSQPKVKRIPILFLTAKGEEVDRIVGLELGGDDYIVKPFSPRELTLRVKAILGRLKPEENTDKIFSAHDITLDTERHQVRAGKKDVALTALEFKFLKLLMERMGRVQTRENLLKDVWDLSSDVTTRTIDTHVKRLRQKLGKSGDRIETVRGIGYRLKEK